MKNGHQLTGEIKSMEYGVLKVKTDYSDSDFAVKWEEVVGLKSSTTFIIMLTTKFRLRGSLGIDPSNPSYLIISPTDGSKMFAKSQNIVYLKSSEDNFWDRFSANLDGGYTITKASNSRQLSVNGSVSYVNTKIQTDIYFSFLYNTVRDTANTISTLRNNYGYNFKYFLNKSWFVMGTSDYLQSEEQNLALRNTVQVGIGKLLLRNHLLFLNSAVGVASNREKFISDSNDDDHTMEAFADVELNGFGFKDFTITSKLQAFPSLSNNKRIRSIFSFSIKYDLPLDFYVGFNTNLNFDNQPGENVSEYDYVIQTTIGWKL
ncbi:DUF481 domain-containing protein [Reichenbachiella agarivorans]|uniref:DUF481 domain-containing protein n=1 Tax=Reichenbachiella agarivorans TaxID=2979464 RepID=A0ABY6CQA2_9BACT|nr:DUF481 domain-containing protein [Reichenbachiella agarivorans]UXP31528.1 DUF481 domain-containing protein [Reichenbachiella agarivorans]